MKKLQNLGTSLSKMEQKRILGGSEEDSQLCTSGSCTGTETCSSIGHGCACHDVIGAGEVIQVCRTGR